MNLPRITVTRHEQVGKSWLTCSICGCKYPPAAWCPYQEFHDGWSEPQVLFPDDRPPRR